MDRRGPKASHIEGALSSQYDTCPVLCLCVSPRLTALFSKHRRETGQTSTPTWHSCSYSSLAGGKYRSIRNAVPCSRLLTVIPLEGAFPTVLSAFCRHSRRLSCSSPWAAVPNILNHKALPVQVSADARSYATSLMRAVQCLRACTEGCTGPDAVCACRAGTPIRQPSPQRLVHHKCLRVCSSGSDKCRAVT